MDTLNDIFYNVIRRVKTLENRPQYRGYSWGFRGSAILPNYHGTLAAGASAPFDWGNGSAIQFSHGFHVDATDTTKLIAENSGRYLFTVTINMGVVQPALGPLDRIPFYLLIEINGVWAADFYLELPLIGGYGDFSSYHYPSVVIPIDVDVGNEIVVSGQNIDLNANVIEWLQYKDIAIEYLGPIIGPPFVVPP